METRTTAQLRDQAREAEDRGQYLTASELYQLAINRYPVHNSDNQLARADIEALRAKSRSCLHAHKNQLALPDASDPLVTTIRAALDERSRAEFEDAFERSIRVIEHALPEHAP